MSVLWVASTQKDFCERLEHFWCSKPSKMRLEKCYEYFVSWNYSKSFLGIISRHFLNCSNSFWVFRVYSILRTLKNLMTIFSSEYLATHKYSQRSNHTMALDSWIFLWFLSFSECFQYSKSSVMCYKIMLWAVYELKLLRVISKYYTASFLNYLNSFQVMQMVSILRTLKNVMTNHFLSI